MEKYYDGDPEKAGSLWTHKITGGALNESIVGANTISTVTIKLANGKTLESLGLKDKKLKFESVWFTGKGGDTTPNLIAKESISSGYIYDKTKDKDYHPSNLTKDGFTSKAMFVEGESKKFDEIKTVHEYKPIIKYESSTPGKGYAAVIEETFPAELVDFIDWDNVYIYSSDINGNPTKDVVKTRIDKPTKDGVINTFNSPAMSHKNVSSKDEVAKVRSYIQDNVLTAGAGGVGFYTISYKLKASLKDPEASKKIIAAAKQTDNNSFLPFSSRLYADWPDKKYGIFAKDDGEPWKILENSEHNSVLDVRDTDGDGLIDFIEYQFGSNTNLVDTDGDGVPDGQEALVDNTKPNDASDYIVKAPTAENTTYNPAVENKIKGTLPKPLIKNPAKPEEDLKVTNKTAGDAIVKLHPYDAKTKTYDKDKVIAEVKIPFDKLEKGEFEMPLAANKVEDGSKGQLVAYAPNGEHPIAGPVLNFNSTDADKFKPEAEKETVPFGGKYDLTDNIKKFKDAKDSTVTPELDDKTPFEDITAKDAINVNQPGEYTGKVRVKYKDGSTEDVEVPVTVLAKVIDQTKNPDAKTPEGYVRVTFEQGEHGTFAKDSKTVLDVVKGTLKSDVTVPTVAPAENFKHTGWTPEIPEKFDNGGTFTATYAAAKTDAEKYTAEGGTVNKPYGEKATEEDVKKKVTVKDESNQALPEAEQKKVVKEIKVGEIPEPGKDGKDQTVPVTVVYEDGTEDKINVTIDYSDAKDKYAPEGQKVTVNKGAEEPKAEDAIKNKDNMPEGTKYAWKTPVDTNTVGKGKATVTVTYPDGSTEDVEVDFEVKETTPAKTDAEKYTAEGGTVNKPYGEKATEEDVKKKVTVKDESNQGLSEAEQKKVVKEIKVGEIPEPGKDGKDQTVPVTVVYEDGTEDKINVTIDYSDAKDKYAPEGQKVTVNKGAEEPKAEDAIKNKDNMPEGTKYAWKTPVDTNTVGKGKATVTVTYPDGSTEDVEVDFEVKETTPAKTDAEKYTAEGGTVNKPYGEKATEAEITDVVTTNAPNERVKSKKIIGDIPTTGVDQKVAVEITYADGSTATVQVLVSYGKAKDAFDPTGQNLSVKQNASEPSPADAITNKDALPANTGYSWTTPVDTSEVGTHEYTVKVTYPDGSEDFVKVNVTVEATAPAQTDAEKYKADGGKVNKPYGQTATAEDVVNAVTTDAPKDKVKSIKAVDAIPTKGKNQPVKVEVTYADGTKDTVTVTVNYMDAADAFNPETKPITVDKGQAPDAKDGIANKEEFPEGTTITWKKPVDTNKPGEKEGTVVVTYPDGSTDEVKVKVVVQDKKTQADENEPKVKDEIIKEGQKPDLTDNVTNLDKLPKGTKVKDITPDGAINPNKPGEYEGTLEIEYPDGSKDVVKVKVTVEKAKTQADENEPKVKDEIIKEGQKPDLTDNVTNLDKLPKGTKVKDITPDGAINPNKPGEYEGTLEIEYPDGSKDTVKVKAVVEKKNVASSDTHSNNNGKKPSGGDNEKAYVNSSSPKTGDTANPSVFAGIMGMAGSVLALIGFKKRKKEDEQE